MMGAMVTTRPVESAWLLHSREEVDSYGHSHGQMQVENAALSSREAEESQET